MISPLFAKAMKTPATILPEAAVTRLREYARHYAQPCPFAVGDLVTPRADCDLKGHGDPHVVIEVDNCGARYFIKDAADSEFGAVFDIRILRICGDDNIRAYWLESWKFEPWTPPAPAETPAEAATTL